MKRLTEHIKRALAALAAADAGEMLTVRQKARYVDDRPSPVAPKRRQVALWAGATVSDTTLDYVLAASKRLDAELLVLHAQANDPAWLGRALSNTSLVSHFHGLPGRTEDALAEFLACHPRVAFLVLDGEDVATSGLIQRAGKSGVPMVVVTQPRDEPSLKRRSRAGAAPLTALA